ncbi:MarR family winged helix-turn-helix transcriptional regulator [Glycomyces niveus]|uniref:MarR family transcriptional regulator n=1 Tax=Glycomyces niveus TaxID=2820287 RepID=A0ABS3U9A9_9ACTN|nr:MarR family transcriptional regulator [Glycomyces sp. NEAU-S30]MBO3735367.1 MarR family transcriptional regulator [Glycomyces sp. NEAU-S30]
MESDADLRFDHDSPERVKRQLSRLTGMTAGQMRKVASAALAGVGAHKDHFVVLASLAETGPASQAQLSDRTRVYRSDLVAVLNELAAAGFVQRAPDPEDKRRNVITVTEAGRERLAELDAVLEGVNEHIMAPLDEDERAMLFRLLARVNAHLADG